jgi:hypothetical protein
MIDGWYTVENDFEYENYKYLKGDLFIFRNFSFSFYEIIDRKNGIIHQCYRNKAEIYELNCRQLTKDELMIKDIIE